MNDGEGLGFAESSQVEEVGFLAEGEEDGAGAPLDVGGGENGDGVFGHGLGEAGAAVVVFAGCDAGGNFRDVVC